MTTDPAQMPATKLDVQLLMEQMGTYFDRTERQITDWKEEIIHEFHVVAENMRHDYMGIHKDRIENHEDRIKRLEKHTGILAA